MSNPVGNRTPLVKTLAATWTATERPAARRVRALTYMNVGESYDHTTKRMKRHYRDLTPKAAVLFGRTLATTLGVAGLHIARIEKVIAERRDAERSALHNALSDLA